MATSFRLLASCQAQLHVPRDCVFNSTAPGEKICCPSSAMGHVQCRGPHRGRCNHVISTNKSLNSFGMSSSWVSDTFDYTCHCKENFRGYMCQLCNFGYYGTNCDIRSQVVRKDVTSLDLGEKISLQIGFELSKVTMSDFVIRDEVSTPHGHLDFVPYKNVSVYDLYSYLHVSSYATNSNINMEEFSYLPWHRYLLLSFERELQTLLLDDTFALPYWNWTASTSGCDICVNDLMGATNYSDPWGQLDQNSVYSDWQIPTSDENTTDELQQPMSITRRPPMTTSDDLTLPTTDDVITILGIPQLLSNDATHTGFSAALQGHWREDLLAEHDEEPPGRFRRSAERSSKLHMSSQVHEYLNGTMSNQLRAVSDPLFFLHYAYVDLLYDTWLREHSDFDKNATLWFSIADNHPVVSALMTTSGHLGYRYSNMDDFFDYMYHNSASHSRAQSDDDIFSPNVSFILTTVIGTIILLPFVIGLLYVVVGKLNSHGYAKCRYERLHTPRTPSLQSVQNYHFRYGSLDESGQEKKAKFFLHSGSDAEYLDSGHFTRQYYKPVPFINPLKHQKTTLVL